MLNNTGPVAQERPGPLTVTTTCPYCGHVTSVPVIYSGHEEQDQGTAAAVPSSTTGVARERPGALTVLATCPHCGHVTGVPVIYRCHEEQEGIFRVPKGRSSARPLCPAATMFSFHKPKVYRSISGCCICGAKSSSSRFTDSAKYEVEFQKCFKLHEERSGEICNACVLLVKRWKKLPKGTDRNWHHVVDARAGPGTKTILKAKFKSKLSKRPNKRRHLLAKKKMGLLRKSRSGEGSDDVSGEEHMSDKSPWSSATPSPALSDQSDESMSACDVDIKPSKCKDIPYPVSSFLNTSYWRRYKKIKWS
uniref:Protein FAM60A n=1 Tax=Branchiostoma floridae TaxID=7739 RepID=C3Y7B8_BRAFL|eukprot:XP_002607736.1 hypothetical protein BRAFLDRAFT_82817 [Branchiostoma floridae]